MRIAVVGGGPAGSAAAGLLARAGHGVTLFERPSSPRERVCGEFVSAEGVPALDRLGVEPAGWPIRRVRVFGGDGGVFEAELPFGGGFGRERVDFDPALRAAAARCGAESRAAVVRTLDARSVDGEPFDAVVDATGRAPLSRGAGARLGGYGFRAAFEADAPGDAVELHLFPGGYAGWSGVASRRANLCLLAPPALARNFAADPDRLLEALLPRSASLRERLSCARRASAWSAVGWPRARFGGCFERGVWYAGDAAATVAPFGGEGIAMALRGGALLADTFAEGPEGYARAWRREFAPRRRWVGWLAFLAVRPVPARIALALLGRMPGLARRVVAATRT